MTTRFVRVDRWDQVLYHCVDDVAAQPGMPAEAIRAADTELTAASDIVFTTAPRLAATRKIDNSRTYFLPNVADYDHFSQAMDEQLEIPADLQSIPAPRIGFVGAVSGYKVNFQLLRDLAERRPEWSFVLIGQVGDGDPWTNTTLLEGLPNLHLMGPRPYGELPAYLKGFDAAMLPSQLNEYTASMFPMKFFEYLAAGLPVVSVDLPATRDFRRAVTLCSDTDGFERGLEHVLGGHRPDPGIGQTMAKRHTWAVRTERMMKILKDGPEPPRKCLLQRPAGRRLVALPGRSHPPVHASPSPARAPTP